MNIPILNNIRPHIKNMIGKSFKEKYLIIESDDWGSIRMPSKEIYHKLKSKGLDLGVGESERYNLTDTLASSQDFEALFEVLRKHKDANNNHPVFTAISVVANPDFEKIKQNNFQSYFFEPFTETLNKYNRSDAINLWKQGKEENLFIPEFHAREHLNVEVWMRMLRNNDSHTRIGLDHGCWGFLTNAPYGISYQASFELEYPDDVINQKEILASGLDLFEQIHGYKASYFVPPNGPINNKLEDIAFQKQIKYIGASKVQMETLGHGKWKKNYHWLGQKNKNGQSYITRNAFFEPNAPANDWVSSCLKDIDYAFKWNKPAVISSHRTNYIGSLDEENRSKSLKQLNELLGKVLLKWPEVQFITSKELGQKL
jgi:hypothetical protein